MFGTKKPGDGAEPKKRISLKRLAVGIVAGFGIFWFGILVGQGRVVLGTDAIFHKSVSKNLPANLDYSSVETLYDSLKTSFDGQLDVNQLLDGLKTGLANSAGDPYTEYFNPKDAKDFNNQLDGTFEGIGAQLAKDADNNIVIVAPIAGFPAEKAGLKPKDIIAVVDGTSTANQNVDQVVNKIRGPKDTQVKLTIVRGSQHFDVTITREQITIPSVSSKVENGIGIMTISQFGKDTTDLANKAAQDFKNKGVKAVILDLRSDPGGLLDAAVNVSSLWLNNKTVLTERRGGQIVQTYKSQGNALLAGLPTVVLIDSGSASASEITAGALRDNGVATLIGTKSFGKGSVQQIVNFADGGELKVTIARWYTPNGNNIDKQGITPDQTVERSDDDAKNGRDPQLDAAMQFLNK